jgi:hypothetical protein
MRRRTASAVGSPAVPRGRYPDEVFKRASKDAAGASQPAGSPSDLLAAGGKGKATPKRREAEAARKTSVVAPPRRGRAGAAGRASARTGKQTPEQMRARREAMRRGDDSALGARDRGPARRFARDFVDSRRSVVGLFIPVAAPIILLGYTRVGILVWLANIGLYAFVIGSILDSMRMNRAIRKQVSIRYPGEPIKGLGMYAVMRAMQFRRMRMPGPRVARGAKV